MIKTAYKMNINQFQHLVLDTKCYMQIWTPKELGRAVAICHQTIKRDIDHNGTQKVDTGDNAQLEDGQIIIITDIN
jgi:hypothetical protein